LPPARAIAPLVQRDKGQQSADNDGDTGDLPVIDDLAQQ
jgi:hypothetical protein